MRKNLRVELLKPPRLPVEPPPRMKKSADTDYVSTDFDSFSVSFYQPSPGCQVRIWLGKGDMTVAQVFFYPDDSPPPPGYYPYVGQVDGFGPQEQLFIAFAMSNLGNVLSALELGKSGSVSVWLKTTQYAFSIDSQ